MKESPGAGRREDIIEDQRSYSSHSDPAAFRSQYDSGLCNRAFASSREKDLHLEAMDKTPTKTAGTSTEDMDCESKPASSLPLVDSLLAYNSTGYGPKVPPRRRSKEYPDDMIADESKNLTNDLDNNVDLKDADAKVATNDVTLYHDDFCVTEKQSKGVQTWPMPPYRLRILPKRPKGQSFSINLNLVGRWAFCQLGLGLLLVLWALAGAAAFRYTEGPAEEMAAQELVTKQEGIVTELVERLKEDKVDWLVTINEYMSVHEKVLTEVGNGGGRGAGGHIWTFPGCLLFAVSLITTLGFGAPVPRTPEGRSVAVAFSAIGIPLHLLLVLNIGMAIAIKLQSYADRRQSAKDKESQDGAGDDISKDENNVYEPKRKTNGIFNTNKHKRSGSEPIGRQAMENISEQVNSRFENLKNVKYFNISESNVEDKQILPNTTPEDKVSSQRLNNEITYSQSNLKGTICKTEAPKSKCDKNDDVYNQPHFVPLWLKWLPLVGIIVYYIIGIIVFGAARNHPLLQSLMFPLDFTMAGGVAHIPGYIRVMYAIYLECAVTMTAITVSILQVSATQGMTNLGLKYGLLTNSR